MKEKKRRQCLTNIAVLQLPEVGGPTGSGRGQLTLSSEVSTDKTYEGVRLRDASYV